MTRRRDIRGERGEFTLPGILVAISIFAGVLGATLVMFQGFESVNRQTQERSEAQDLGRSSVDRLAKELRNLASPTQDKPESVDVAGPYELIFQTVDAVGPNSGLNAANVMRVRYCLNSVAANATLYRQIQRWTTVTTPAVPSTTTCPSGSWTGQEVAAQHVVNRNGGQDRPVFSYNSASAADVSAIRADLYVDMDAAKDPVETRLSTGVFLRNQNRRPTARFETPQVTPAGIVLNGSASSDPEGENLKFVWYDGATKVGDGITYLLPVNKNSTHQISLRVYDPAGLESIAPAVTVTA